MTPQEQKAFEVALKALDYAGYLTEPEGDLGCNCLICQATISVKEILTQQSNEQVEPVALVIDGVLVKSALPEKYTGHLYTAPPQPKEPEQEPVSDRENKIIRFALHQFMSNAYAQLSAAAQDKDHQRYPSDAIEKFSKDAKDAQALLERLQFTTPPQRKPLTDEEHESLVEDIADWSRYVEVDTAHQSLEKHVRQVLTAHGIKENT